MTTGPQGKGGHTHQQQQSMDGNISKKVTSQKQYKYWIDVAELLSMVQFTHTCLTSVNFAKQLQLQKQLTTDQTNPQRQALQDNRSRFTQNQRQSLESIVEKDLEIQSVLNFITTEMQISLDDLLQLDQGAKKVYLIENQKVITQVYQQKLKQEVVQSLASMADCLVQYQSKFKNKTLRLCFTTQAELFSIFFKVFGSEFYQSPLIRKILQEIWESCKIFRIITNTKSLSHMNSYFYFMIELYCRGRALYSTTHQEFPLHRAVFENNLPLISRLVNCKHDGVFYADKNQIDSCGNTPLLLAVKLGYIDTIKVLCDLFTCPKLKPLTNYPCALDIASALKNKEILRILLEANQKLKQHYLDLHKEAIFRALESLPDFKIDMHFSCKSSYIPFVKNITPSDTYKIYKQGSMIRLDMTLIGFRKLKCIRGNISVLFKGRGQTNEGELYVVDHDNKSVQNIFHDIGQSKIDKDLEDILTEQNYQKQYKAERFQIQPEQDKKGEIRQKNIEGYKAEKYQVKTTFTMTKFKINMKEVQDLQRFKSFQNYLKNNSIDIINNNCSWTDNAAPNNEQPTAQPQTGFSWNPFSNQTAQPAEARTETDKDQPNQFYIQDNTAHKERQPTGNTMGYATNKKTTKKTINANIWLSKAHPLSLDSFFPLLHVLSFSSKQIAKFKDYLVRYQLPQGSFPLKAKVPLFLSMKAAFSLRNLTFDTSDFSKDLFTIDENYIKIRMEMNQNLASQGKLVQLLNNKPTDNVSQTLKEIYKLCKTDEAFNEEDEDSDSLERANELFNSMMKKQPNQSEELLLEMSSFHSDHDSLELSEKHLNDDSFKLSSHAFHKVQTMDQINVRHDSEDNVPSKKPNTTSQKLIHDYQQMQQIQRKENQTKGSLDQNIEGENLMDSKVLEVKPRINFSVANRHVSKVDRPPANKSLNPRGSNAETAKTLKKSFQPKNLKNYKNMIKYGSNQTEDSPETASQSTAAKDPNTSTADTSLFTNKISQFFVSQNNMGKGSTQSTWFKKLVNGKHHGPNIGGGAKIGGGGYLQTIESEEIQGTEGNDNLSQIGKQSHVGTSSNLVTQNNFDDALSRKSFMQNFQNFNGNQPSSSREGSNKSFNSGSNTSQQQRNTYKVQHFPHNVAQNDYVPSKRKGSQSTGSQRTAPNNINKEERMTLVNHNQLISRFHSYLNQQQQNAGVSPAPTSSSQSNQAMHTPPKVKSSSYNSATIQTPTLEVQENKDQGNHSKQSSEVVTQSMINSDNTLKQSRQSYTNNMNKALLPPKVTHRKQLSYGGSGSGSNMSSYLGSITQGLKPNGGTGSGGIFNKMFGTSFNQTSSNVLAPPVQRNSAKESSEINPFSAIQPVPGRDKSAHPNSHTFDYTKNTSRSASNTQYGQGVPSNLKGLLTHANKKTNDVDIFLPYQA